MGILKYIIGVFRYLLGAVLGILLDIVMVSKMLISEFEGEGGKAPSFTEGLKSTYVKKDDIEDFIKEELKSSKPAKK